MKIEKRDVYIAEDGTPFLTRKLLVNYEESIAKEVLTEEIHKIIEEHFNYDMSSGDITNIIITQIDSINSAFSKYNSTMEAFIEEE